MGRYIRWNGKREDHAAEQPFLSRVPRGWHARVEQPERLEAPAGTGVGVRYPESLPAHRDVTGKLRGAFRRSDRRGIGGGRLGKLAGLASPRIRNLVRREW